MTVDGAGAHDVPMDEEPPGEASAEGHVKCDSGFANAYPCMNVDLVEVVPRAAFGGTPANDIWDWTDPESKLE